MSRMVVINKDLIRSRNPSEYEIEVNGGIGKVVHRLDDGYNLVEFPITIRKKIYIGLKWFYGEPEPLQWYIHDDDLICL